MTVPTWGVPAYVNADDPASPDPNYPDDYTYYSDYRTWSLPIGCFTVNEHIITLWVNTNYRTGAGSDMTQTLQCRYAVPASPVELGEVVDLWSMSVPQVSVHSTISLPADQARGGIGLWDQQTMGTAIIGTDLYLQLGIYRDDYTGITITATPHVPATHDGYAVFVKVDCSGDVPALAVLREDNIGFVDTDDGYFDNNDAMTYCLAAVDGRLLALTQYAGGVLSDMGYVMELDLDTLDTLWSDPLPTFSGSRPEIPFVAHSDTDQSWLTDWEATFWPFTLGSSSVTFGTGSALFDDSLTGITLDYDGFGGVQQLYEYIQPAEFNLYPTAAMRGPAPPNGMMLANGATAWLVWYDTEWHWTTIWMFDYNSTSTPAYDPSVSPPYPRGYGFGFANGPSYAFATRISGNELLFMPRYDGGVNTNNDIYIDVGLDTQPEESLAAFVHEPVGVQLDWAPHVCAAQLIGGTGILLIRGDAVDFPPIEFAGQVQAVPFFLGFPIPNLAGAFDAQDRAFWRPRP